MTASHLVWITLVAATVLPGCADDSPPSSPTDPNPDGGPGINEARPEVWYFHHVGGCNAMGQAILNGSAAIAEYERCNVPDDGEHNGSVPVESFASHGEWPSLKAGSLIQGRFRYEWSTVAVEAEVKFVVSWNGTIHASTQYLTNPVLSMPGSPPGRLYNTEFLSIEVTRDLPTDAWPTFDFYVTGTDVYDIIYEDDPYLCFVPADDPKIDAHRNNPFRDCHPENH